MKGSCVPASFPGMAGWSGFRRGLAVVGVRASALDGGEWASAPEAASTAADVAGQGEGVALRAEARRR